MTDVTTTNLKINILSKKQYEGTTPSNSELYFVEEEKKHVWLSAISATVPENPQENDIYFNTTSKKLFTYKNSEWDEGVTPSTDVVYILKTTNCTYAWNGTDLVQIGDGGITVDELDNETITLNSENKLQASGVVNKAGGKVYNWVGTKTEYEALTEIHEDWLYYITDDEDESSKSSINNIYQRLNRAYAWTSHNISGNGSVYFIEHNGNSYYSSDAFTGLKVINDNSSDFAGNKTHVIIDGKLYYKNMTVTPMTLTQIGSDSTWTDYACYSSGNTETMGINNGNLYYILNSTVTLKDSSGWQKIAWCPCYSGTKCVGIKNDSLYMVSDSGNTITLLDSSGVWKTVCGKLNGESCYSFGIKDGKLYSISNTGVVNEISSETTWTQICGYLTNNYSSNFTLGINNSKLYALRDDAVYLVDDTETWVKCCGFYSSGYSAFALTQSGKLYKVNCTSSSPLTYTITQIGSDSTWTDISGYGQYSVGINNGDVYLNLNNPTRLTTIGGFSKVYGALYNNLASGGGTYWTGSVTDDVHTVYTVPSPEVGYTEYSDKNLTVQGTITTVNTNNNTISDGTYTYTRDSLKDTVFNGVSNDTKNQLLSVYDLIAAIKG